MITKTAPRTARTERRTSRPIVQVPVEKCHPHPDNRQVRDVDCAELAESLEAEGLLQPILIRSADRTWAKIPIGHYQIVFGERRWRAAKLLGWETIAAEVAEDLDDPTALRLMAIENAQRQDLNPIEQARALKRLCDPPASGGGGLTREDAAKVFGLETGPAASNKIRLLELPDVWQQRVISGEIPETVARQLLPYVAAGNLMGAIDKRYRTEKHARERYVTRAGMEQLIKWQVRDHCRRLDAKQEWHSSIHTHAGCLFKATDEQRAKLHVVTINIDGKPVQVAQNVKLFDELQKEAHEAKEAKARARAQAKSSKNGKPTKVSAAEQKQLAEKQARQLENRIHEWREQWIRWHVAKLVRPGDWQILKCLVWAAAGGDFGSPLRRLLETKGIKCDWDLWPPMSKIEGQKESWDGVAQQFAAVILAGELEGPPPNLPDDVIDGLAADYGFDVAAAWRTDQQDPHGRDWITRFFELHQAPQLEELADELGVHVSAAKGRKAGMVNLIAIAMTSKTLPLPPALALKRGRKRK